MLSSDPTTTLPDACRLVDYDKIVGAIYDCVLAPSGWPAALAQVCAEIGGTAAWIAVHYPGQVRSTNTIEVGTDPEWQRRLRQSYVASSPFIGMAHYVRAGDVLSVDDVIDYDEFRAGRFYTEWAAPQGWPDLVFAVLAKEADRFSFLGVCLPARASAAHKRQAAIFLPHLNRALRIADLLELREAQHAELAASVELLSTGMILVDERLGVCGVNSSAERLLSKRLSLSLQEKRLRVAASGAGKALSDAITACAQGQVSRGGVTVAFASDSGELDLIVQVMPLSALREGVHRQAVAALFLSNPAVSTHNPLDVFVEQFRLTPSETRIALGLLEGRSAIALAEAQGVAIATVRTHLRSLYDKTQTNGQAAVVRLMTAVTKTI